MQDHIISWLLKPPEASLSPALDMCVLLPMRIAYLTLRYLSRLIFRNEERIRQLRILHTVFVWLSGFFSPSIYTAKMTDRIIRKLGPSRQPFMIKVTVPKYGYRYFCKISDFAPGRENDIIEHFNPAEGNIVIDVGAHVGRYSILGSKLVGRSGKVIAVEPHPGNFQLLKRNLQINTSENNNVITLNCAAYCRDTPQLRLFLAGEDRGNTIYNTVMESRHSTEKFVTIPALKLDSIVQYAGIQAHEINWIKIDVEGAEYEVLQGAQNILSNSRDIAVLVEVHNLQNKNLHNPIIDMLRKYKFSIIFEKVYDSGERHIIGRKSPAGSRQISVIQG
jgi:FkbM family methyltransferase